MKRYGVRVTLPPEDPMRAAHLLGENWEWVRWFDDATARDEAYHTTLRQFGYYRKGDVISQVVEKIEQDA